MILKLVMNLLLAAIACAHEFIMSLGQGYATQLSERGSNLSGGQRQRIAIARTVLSNPQLLVMDEATSALDYNTEKQLCINLQNWASGRTVFFITHRLSSIKNSDLILVMHNGELVEQGTHRALVDKSERYAHFIGSKMNDMNISQFNFFLSGYFPITACYSYILIRSFITMFAWNVNFSHLHCTQEIFKDLTIDTFSVFFGRITT